MRTRKTLYAVVAAVGVAGPLLLGGGPANAALGDRALINTKSNLALTALQKNGAGEVIEGSKVGLKAFGSTDNSQKWIATSPSFGVVRYQLRSAVRGTNGALVSGCLDLPGDVDRSQQRPGEILVIRRCDSSNSQRWTKFGVQSTPGVPKFRLNNVLSAMSIDVTGVQFTSAFQDVDDGGIAETTQSFTDPVVN